MASNAFEKDLQKWMKKNLSPYCLDECGVSCCEGEGLIQIDKGYEKLFKTFRLSGKKVPIQGKNSKKPYLFQSKKTGLWYFDGDACPNFDPKNKRCLIHNQYPRCKLYPLLKTGKGYTIFSVCSLHRLGENQEPLKSLIQLCKKHKVRLFKENVDKLPKI
jgi:Fe-S-cluster containining protein